MNPIPRAAIEEELSRYLTSVAAERGKPAGVVDADSPFFETGLLDSMRLLEFVAFIERRFGIDIASRDVVAENFGTLRNTAAYVDGRLRTGGGVIRGE